MMKKHTHEVVIRPSGEEERKWKVEGLKDVVVDEDKRRADDSVQRADDHCLHAQLGLGTHAGRTLLTSLQQMIRLHFRLAVAVGA